MEWMKIEAVDQLANEIDYRLYYFSNDSEFEGTKPGLTNAATVPTSTKGLLTVSRPKLSMVDR